MPFREGKQFNVYRLVSRLGLTKYDLPAPMVETDKTFSKVNLLLSQHIGAPAVAVVNVGDHVERGQLIGDIPEGKLSSKVFASISGRISAADSEKSLSSPKSYFKGYNYGLYNVNRRIWRWRLSHIYGVASSIYFHRFNRFSGNHGGDFGAPGTILLVLVPGLVHMLPSLVL